LSSSCIFSNAFSVGISPTFGVLGGRPLAVIEGGQVFWLSWDHILRPVLATDATGSVVWAARYLPFGGIDQVSVDTGALEQNLRFPGQWFQAETGLHQNGMRDYDPTTGRYLQADPLGLVDGPSVYGYARQSPVRWTDPRGLDSTNFDKFVRDAAKAAGKAGRGASRAPHPVPKIVGYCLWAIAIVLGSGDEACAGECPENDDGCREWFEELYDLYEELIVRGPEHWPSFEEYNDAAERYNETCVPKGHPRLPLIPVDPNRRF
jgi:RHS repeat-associated protein